MRGNTVILDLTSKESSINSGVGAIAIGVLFGIVANFSKEYFGWDCHYILAGLSVLAGVGFISYGIGIGQIEKLMK